MIELSPSANSLFYFVFIWILYVERNKRKSEKTMNYYEWIECKISLFFILVFTIMDIALAIARESLTRSKVYSMNICILKTGWVFTVAEWMNEAILVLILNKKWKNLVLSVQRQMIYITVFCSFKWKKIFYRCTIQNWCFWLFLSREEQGFKDSKRNAYIVK